MLRRSFAGAAAALARADGTVPALDGAPLGLPGLETWVGLASGLSRGKTTVAALLAFADAQPLEVLAREALGDAARIAVSPSEKRSVRAALDSRLEPDPRHARAVIARALALARVAASPAAGRGRLAGLASAWPDAPERAADLFDEIDRKAFDAAMTFAPPAARAARARSIAARDPKQAVALLKSLGVAPSADARTPAAEAWLAVGSPKDALRVLALALPAGVDDSDAVHRAALTWLADVRSLVPPRARAARSRRVRTQPKTLPALSPAQRAAADARLAELSSLLSRPLGEEDRRHLLENGLRLARRAGRHEQARVLLGSLLEIDPANDAGAAEAFREGFDLYTAGRWAEAACVFDEQAGLYREVTARRRATYWAAKARERLGDIAGSRALYANLVPGAAPDLYGRWAASALGLSVVAAAPAAADDAAESESPLAPSREFMLCGFPDLAGDAAELEGTLDPVFAARVAAGTGDYRRATALLKRRFPELGTPEEGAVPAAARRAYYPVAHAGIVEAAALRAGVPASLLFGLIRQESVFTADVRSRAGALGLMQVMPATGRTLYRRENGGKGRPDLRDPGENVRLGTLYLRDLLAQFQGDTAAAVAAYNAGPARVRAWKRAAGSAPLDEFLESIPITETRVYVKRVLYFQGAYAALYGLPLDGAAPHREGDVPASP